MTTGTVLHNNEAAVLRGSNGSFPRKRFTVAECRSLQDGGLLEAGKYELIEGDIVFKMPQGYAHKACLSLLIIALSGKFENAFLRDQTDFGVGKRDPHNDPEPDMCWLEGSPRDYLDREPEPNEVLLVCEVAASSLEGDTTVKTGIYARQDLQEYWVVDVVGRVLHVYRDPVAGNYASHETLTASETVSPLAAPNALITVADILP